MTDEALGGLLVIASYAAQWTDGSSIEASAPGLIVGLFVLGVAGILVVIALAVVLACGAMTAPALAQTPAPAAAAATLSADSTIDQLKANPAAWAVITRELPEIASSTQVPGNLSISALAQYAPQLVTPEKLATINTALAAIH